MGKPMVKTKLALLLCLFILSGCSIGNIDYVKERAEKTWQANGFKVVSYQGYQYGVGIPFTCYGGAQVWYVLHKYPDNGIIYEGSLQRWKDEVHVYNLRAIGATDAIRKEFAKIILNQY